MQSDKPVKICPDCSHTNLVYDRHCVYCNKSLAGVKVQPSQIALLLDTPTESSIQALLAMDVSTESSIQALLAIDVSTIILLTKNYERVLTIYENAIHLYNENALLWQNKAYVLVKQRRFEKAYEAYKDAFLRTPAYASLSKEKSKQTDTPQYLALSLEACESILQLDPDNAAIYYQKGHLLGRLGKYNEALIAQEKALSCDPHFAPAHLAKGLILQQLGKPQEALRAYMKGREAGYTG